jgi:hypothetical protein
MPLGVGAGGVGVVVVGYGGVDAAPVQQQTILIESTTGIPQNARKIDPFTGQYVYDADDRVEGMNGVQQLVLLRVNTLLKSSAVRGLGMPAPSGVIGSNIVLRLEQEIRRAMKDLTDTNQIEIIKVVVEKIGPNKIGRFFLWRDLTSGNGNQSGNEQKTAF